MARAGSYADRLEWGQKTAGTPDAFGDRKPSTTYPSQGYLWCAVEDVGASRETKKEGERQLTTATVRIRNAPAVAAGDRLGDWTVLTVTAGANELTCEVEK